MNTKQGIRGLMHEKRFSITHIQSALIDRNVPGNWHTYQNVYNFVSGKMPRDCYAFIVVSQLLNVSIEEILMRYSTVKEELMPTRELEQDLNW